MEDKKYYVPEIEEFCVGFEFEMKNSSHPEYFDWELCKAREDFSNELNKDYLFEYLSGDLKEGYIRVKYLDEQDILDLGFEYTNNDRDLVKDGVRIRTYIGHRFKVPNITVHIKKSSHEHIVFSGETKNKEVKDITTNFYVNIEKLYGVNKNDRTLETIMLDQEDLDYLYKKYLPAYKVVVEEELKEANEKKQQEIAELEQKLDKLKNEILDNI